MNVAFNPVSQRIVITPSGFSILTRTLAEAKKPRQVAQANLL
jgi:hypothetical protein